MKIFLDGREQSLKEALKLLAIFQVLKSGLNKKQERLGLFG